MPDNVDHTEESIINEIPVESSKINEELTIEELNQINKGYKQLVEDLTILFTELNKPKFNEKVVENIFNRLQEKFIVAEITENKT